MYELDFNNPEINEFFLLLFVLRQAPAIAAQTGFDLVNLLLQHECWDCRHQRAHEETF
jgi:hypothetical protein